MKERRFSSAAIQKIKLGRRETFPDIVRRVSKHELCRLMTMTQLKAAKTIGISPTTLKKLCRHYGIPRWPFRKIAGADRAADRLDVILAELPVQRQSTAKSASRVEGHHRGNAVGEATISRATSTHELFRYGVYTDNNPHGKGMPIMNSVGATARGAAFVNHHQTPSSTPSSTFSSGGSSPLYLSKCYGGGGGTSNVSVGFTTYADLIAHSLGTTPSFS